MLELWDVFMLCLGALGFQSGDLLNEAATDVKEQKPKSHSNDWAKHTLIAFRSAEDSGGWIT